MTPATRLPDLDGTARRDRRLAQVAADTFERSRIGGFLYVIGWVAVAITGRADIAYFAWSLGIGLAFLAIAALRMTYRPPASDAAGQRAWLRRYGAVMVASPLVWGAAQTWLLLDPYFDVNTQTVSLVATIGYATVFANVYSTSRTLAAIGIAALFVPPIVALLSQRSQLTIAIAYLMYAGYLVFAVLHSHAEYRRRLLLDEALLDQRDRFERLSREDALTGLHNRRHFTAMLDAAAAKVRTEGATLALLILDIDHFKLVNDRHGHAIGDACLVAFAQRLAQSFPPTGTRLLARLGGEEFGVILAGPDADSAFAQARRFRDVLAGEPLFCEGRAMPITVSIGVGRFDAARHGDADDLYRDVDAALYAAKAEGRNRVCASPGVPAGD